MKTKYISTCCKAKALTAPSDIIDFYPPKDTDQITHSFICEKCKKPCDVKEAKDE